MNKSKLILILFTVFFAVNFGFSQVGINTDNPLSTLDINGNLSLKAVVLNGNGSGNGGTSVVINDGVYISLNPQTADDKFELPNPTLFPGRVYIIRNIKIIYVSFFCVFNQRKSVIFKLNSRANNTNFWNDLLKLD